MLMHERLNEQGGMSLALRFVMYVDFLVQCVRLLSRWGKEFFFSSFFFFGLVPGGKRNGTRSLEG